MHLLHFSDVHGNSRAEDAVLRVAATWKDACVAITGDLTSSLGFDHVKYGRIKNPRLWLVRGNHEKDPEGLFGPLDQVAWKAPYLIREGRYAILGLDCERDTKKQLNELTVTDEDFATRALIVLHHYPYGDRCPLVLAWAQADFPRLACIALLHGHKHHETGFFAHIQRETVGGIPIVTSHVYSGQTGIGVHEGCPIRPIGCGVLLDIRENGRISAKPVFDCALRPLLSGRKGRRA